jgi:hypothetical protein
MGHAKLIEVVEKLSSEQQANVFNFAEFLLVRYGIVKSNLANAGIIPKSLADLLAHPLEVRTGFNVVKREELYDRDCIH